MPHREKELTLRTRFLVLGLVCSTMISVLVVAAFSTGSHLPSASNAGKRFEQSGMKMADGRPMFQRMEKGDDSQLVLPSVR